MTAHSQQIALLQQGAHFCKWSKLAGSILVEPKTPGWKEWLNTDPKQANKDFQDAHRINLLGITTLG